MCVWCVVCLVVCVCVCGEIHGETYGPNSREIVAGAFVAWCPPKYLGCVCVWVCVCGVWCVLCCVCVVKYTAKPIGRIVAK